MSISSLSNRVDYVGTGLLTEYDYTFRIFAESHLLATTRTTLGDEATLVLNTDYTVDGVGDATGGSITLTTALASGTTLTIRRVLPLTQTTDIRNQSSFYPETHEDQFDRGVMIAQQQQDEIDRSVKIPESVDGDDFDVSLPADIEDHPNAAVIVNSTGDGFSFLDIDTLSSPPAVDGSLTDITIVAPGKGFVVTTPDGLHTWRLRVDNDGNIVSEQVS